MIPKLLLIISLSRLVGLCSAVGPTWLKAHDPSCKIRFSVSETKNCRPVRYFYNNETGLCGRTCSHNAPFSTLGECDMSCRSVVVCYIQRRPRRCDGSFSVKVFRFNVNKGKCYAKRGCTYRGNNFPTLEECMSTCGAGAGSSKESDGDDGGSSPLGQQMHVQTSIQHSTVQIPPSVTQPIVPELPNIGGAPSIRKRITDQEQTRVAAPTSPAENPPLLSDTAGESGISQRDERCTVNVPKSSPSCKSSMYHFDQNTRLCRRTCSDQAPFQSKSECDGICRSVLVCFDKKRPQPCETHSIKIVYYFDAQKGKCFARTGCTHTGNNFPTIQECKLTCGAYIGQTEVDQEIARAPSNERPSQQLSEGTPSQETPPSIGSEGTTPAEGNVVSPNGRPAFTIPAVGTPLPPNRPHAGEMPAIAEPAMPMPPTTGAAPATPEESKPDTSDAQTTSAIPTQDHRCSVIVSKVTDASCKSQMYYFDSRTRLCNPTCSEMAPFHSRVACIGICRSVLVCFVKRLPNMCGGNRNITVYYYNPRKGRCFVEKGCTYKGNNFPTLGECQRTCGAFTGLEEPSEEESNNGNTESTNELPLEQPEEHATEQVPSTTPVPTIPPTAAPSGTGIVSLAPQNEPVTVGPLTTTPAPMTLPVTQPFETMIMPAVPHHDSRCIIFFPGSENEYCKGRRYYFDSRRRLCMPSCSKWAPFQSSSECNGLCRSVLVCFIERRNALCKTRRTITVFYYDFHKGKCVNGKGCDYRGNSFPTSEECERTCSPITGAHEPALDSGIHVITSPSQPSSEVHHMQYHPNTLAEPPALPHIPVHHVNGPRPPPLVREAEHVSLDRLAVPKPPPFNIPLVTPVQQPVTLHPIQPAVAQKHSSTVKASPLNRQVVTQQKLIGLNVPTDHHQQQIAVLPTLQHQMSQPLVNMTPGSSVKHLTPQKLTTSAISPVHQEHSRSPMLPSFQQHVTQQHLSTPTLPLNKQPAIEPKLGVPLSQPFHKHVTQQQEHTSVLSPISQEASLKRIKVPVPPQTQQVTQHKLNSQVVLLTEKPSSPQVPNTPKSLPAQQVVKRHNLETPIEQPSTQEQTDAQKLSVVPQLTKQQVLTTSTATQTDHKTKLLPPPKQVISQTQAQTTQKQMSTTMGSPTQLLVTQRHSTGPVSPQYQHWRAPQQVSSQMFPVFPRPLPFGFR